MNTILEKILADKKKEVAQRKRALPLSALKKEMARRPKPRDFAAALRGPGLKLIAEVKKASPSKGVFKEDFDPVGLAKTYERSGVAAISVLTEEEYFQGSLEHLAAIRQMVKIPLLRKDFIYEEYQVYESAVNGADALLLIVAILKQEALEKLMALSASLGLACLVEVHNESELTEALLMRAEIIGINNRDLKTFKVDINTTRRLRLLIPEENIVVSESGIATKDDIKKMRECKVNAVLVGEALVTAEDIQANIRSLMS
ncbi:MAG: indole-3-glycerol phosphate synthase [Chloroflexi bacterium RBG_16_58_8]|nr:MAG: indole-3-glycerol phosphate synthase [Chloroflexi bacterium RBG_16_58_8]